VQASAGQRSAAGIIIMDKFIVSARKYRPQNFSTVVGQAHITTTLKNAIKNNQLAHAFLFCGPRGVGKTTCARILAKTINCENPGADGEACNTCHSCVSFNEGTSLNIHELDAASNNSVDDIRTLVEQVRFAPQAGRYKVYIIDEVHMLSSSAFNAFLKTLEEPPAYAIFILATTEKHKILPTILSRCQIFDFKRITLNDTVDHLQEICDKEQITAEKAALQVISQKSEGCMRDALSILDKIVSFTNAELTYQNTLEHLNILDADYYFKMLDAMTGQDLAAAMLLYDDINRKGFEGDLVLGGFAEFIRNLLVCKDPRVAGLLDVVEGFRDKYVEASGKTSAAYLVTALNVLNESEIQYKQARNKRLHVELALIKLCYLQQAVELAEGGKKKRIDAPVAFRVMPIKALRVGSEGNAVEKVDTVEKVNRVNEVEEVNEGHGGDGGEKAGEEAMGAKLVIETPPVAKKTQAEAQPSAASQSATAATTSGSAKLSGLNKIRQQFAQPGAPTDTTELKPLTIENLREAWSRFSQQLKENKNQAYQGFDNCAYKVVDDNSIEIITTNPIDNKFIEQERRALSEYLQTCFGRIITATLSFEERAVEQPEDYERPLSSKEQYQKLAEQYPLIKDLRDRFRMDLDY
jgi:DNA polymerase III subunit gamma/tau